MTGVTVAANARPARCARRVGTNMQRVERPRKLPGAAYWIPAFAGMTFFYRGPQCTHSSRRRPKILRLQFDRRAVRRAVGGVVPGVAIAAKGVGGGDAFLGNQLFKRGKPVPIVGFAVVGIAASLRAPDFVGERSCPFVPGKKPALMQRKRHRKGLRLPWFAKYRAIIGAGNARDSTGRMRSGGLHHAASRLGSQ